MSKKYRALSAASCAGQPASRSSQMTADGRDKSVSELLESVTRCPQPRSNPAPSEMVQCGERFPWRGEPGHGRAVHVSGQARRYRLLFKPVHVVNFPLMC